MIHTVDGAKRPWIQIWEGGAYYEHRKRSNCKSGSRLRPQGREIYLPSSISYHGHYVYSCAASYAGCGFSADTVGGFAGGDAVWIIMRYQEGLNAILILGVKYLTPILL